MTEQRNIDLALSGGGIRAMVFHLGVLRRLAELGQLEKVRRISSVSGGSLIAGLIVTEAEMRWPGSNEFLSDIYPALREKLCRRSIMKGMIVRLLQPSHIRFLLNRANLLAYILNRDWGVKARLRDLPQTPEFSFEGTTAENGRRFRFKRDSMGDYESGYTGCGKLPLATAMAVSAAFPGGIGPLLLYTSPFDWVKRTDDPTPVTPPFEKLHLYDGGVYDNLGLEPFFDVNQNRPRRQDGYLLVSDAGAPFKKGFSMFALNPLRLKRVMEVMQEQCRALRVRGLHGFLNANPGHGSYVWINAGPKDPALLELRDFAAGYPTTLSRMKPHDFDRLAEYGYQVALDRIHAGQPAQTATAQSRFAEPEEALETW
ncbi:patatin-like phospholipase family protein [Desulfovibrio sp. OttesenSCG-928-C06]|nr:patatin-like phospholipase family protein [Desulfovibrio sp. OttesenSCG-928-C06]